MLKQSLYRPGQALRVTWGWVSQISRHSAHEVGKVVSPTHRPPLPPRKYPWYTFLLETIVRPEGLSQWKIPVIQSCIEPANLGLVAGNYNVELRILYCTHHIPIPSLSSLSAVKRNHFEMPFDSIGLLRSANRQYQGRHLQSGCEWMRNQLVLICFCLVLRYVSCIPK